MRIRFGTAIIVTSIVLVAALTFTGVSSHNETVPVAGATVDIDPGVADTATFAGGCFWCMEPPYDRVEGVAATISGFSGGHVSNPSYEDVTSGGTGHTEAVQVIFDKTQVDYEHLLYVYWRNVDPLDDGGQFCDRGDYYRPVIFVHNDEQRSKAEASKQALIDEERFDEPIVVPVESFDSFYAAEEYHQNFYQKNPGHYNRYREACGRDARLTELWGEEANP